MLVVAALFSAAAARGDGGRICVSGPAGPFVVTVFTAPIPLRVGPIDVSVLVQSAADQAPVIDAAVQLTLRSKEIERTAAATHAGATNKLLYAASIDVPTAGEWTLAAAVRVDASTADVGCELEVVPPPPPVVAFWPYLVLPFAITALFAVHQRLKARRR